MINLDPNNLFVQFDRLAPTHGAAAPRRYTATHTAQDNALHLTIGPSYHQDIAPVWSATEPSAALFAEWRTNANGAALHVFCGSHVQIGTLERCGGEPQSIRLFVQAVRHADKHLFSAYPALDSAPVFVHCAGDGAAAGDHLWGQVNEFRLPEPNGPSIWAQYEMPRWQSLNAGYDPI